MDSQLSRGLSAPSSPQAILLHNNKREAIQAGADGVHPPWHSSPTALFVIRCAAFHTGFQGNAKNAQKLCL
eukprot:scaffold91926_cov15-Tisochrysis_lutea.AAC.1